MALDDCCPDQVIHACGRPEKLGTAAGWVETFPDGALGFCSVPGTPWAGLAAGDGIGIAIAAIRPLFDPMLVTERSCLIAVGILAGSWTIAAPAVDGC